MPELCRKELCTGCGSCENRCPQSAIRLEVSGSGFAYPVIDEHLCLECGLCESSCPILYPVERGQLEPTPFAAWVNDETIRRQSSSGGLFTLFASEIIAQGGVVFGVKCDEHWNVVFDRAERVDELAKFRTSKYVQADTGRVYTEVAEVLRENRQVLFTGTPCQVAALYAFCRQNVPDSQMAFLYTVDIVCTGVPSQKLFHVWLDSLQKKYGEIETINFRPNRYGWDGPYYFSLVTRTGHHWIPYASQDGAYGHFFLKLYSLRDSCYACRFAKIRRPGDLTIADFWGLGRCEPFRHEKKHGVSLCLVNSERGEELRTRSQSHGTYVPRSLREATLVNVCLFRPVSPPLVRPQFLSDMESMDFESLAKKYCPSRYDTWKQNLKYRIWMLLMVIFRWVPGSYFLFRMVRNTVYRLMGKKIPGVSTVPSPLGKRTRSDERKPNFGNEGMSEKNKTAER